MINRKLWVIGDSFTGMYPNTWINHLIKNFNGNDFYISSNGSRDVQSILDIFLRNLKDIGPDDLVILFLPTLKRGRLPLKTPKTDVEYSKTLLQEDDKKKHLDYFIGIHSYQFGIEHKTLEEPLTDISDKDFENLNFKLNYNLVEIVNSSNASKNNFEEIIKSLKSYLPFELLIYSWTDELDISEVFTYSKIEKMLGFWESSHMLYNKTKGELGVKDDFHWSDNMNDAFGNYIVKEYPKYFN
jgi:hypothetical protein